VRVDPNLTTILRRDHERFVAVVHGSHLAGESIAVAIARGLTPDVSTPSAAIAIFVIIAVATPRSIGRSIAMGDASKDFDSTRSPPSVAGRLEEDPDSVASLEIGDSVLVSLIFDGHVPERHSLAAGSLDDHPAISTALDGGVNYAIAGLTTLSSASNRDLLSGVRPPRVTVFRGKGRWSHNCSHGGHKN